VALPFFGHASVAFTAVRSGSASGNTHFEVGRVRPVHTCAYVSPRHYWSCRKAHFRLRGLAWPGGSLTPLDDSTEFQFFILFLLSVQHFLVTPHVGAAQHHRERICACSQADRYRRAPFPSAHPCRRQRCES
jgi:hypothetical protein